MKARVKYPFTLSSEPVPAAKSKDRRASFPNAFSFPDIHRIGVKKIDYYGVKIFQGWGGIEIF